MTGVEFVIARYGDGELGLTGWALIIAIFIAVIVGRS